MKKRGLTLLEDAELTFKAIDRRDRLIVFLYGLVDFENEWDVTEFEDIELREEDGNIYFTNGYMTATHKENEHRIHITFTMSLFGKIEIIDYDLFLNLNEDDTDFEFLSEEDDERLEKLHREFEKENNIIIDYDTDFPIADEKAVADSDDVLFDIESDSFAKDE